MLNYKFASRLYSKFPSQFVQKLNKRSHRTLYGRKVNTSVQHAYLWFVTINPGERQNLTFSIHLKPASAFTPQILFVSICTSYRRFHLEPSDRNTLQHFHAKTSNAADGSREIGEIVTTLAHSPNSVSNYARLGKPKCEVDPWKITRTQQLVNLS